MIYARMKQHLWWQQWWYLRKRRLWGMLSLVQLLLHQWCRIHGHSGLEWQSSQTSCRPTVSTHRIPFYTTINLTFVHASTKYKLKHNQISLGLQLGLLAMSTARSVIERVWTMLVRKPSSSLSLVKLISWTLLGLVFRNGPSMDQAFRPTCWPPSECKLTSQ